MSAQLAADLGLSTLRRLSYVADGALSLEPQIANLDGTSATVAATLAAPGVAMIGKKLIVYASSIANAASVAFTGPGGATTITFGRVNDAVEFTGLTAAVWSVSQVPAASGALTQTFSTADATHAARTAVALTDSSGGTPATTLAAVTNVANAGSADVAPTANAIASLATQLNALRADQVDTASFLNSLVDKLQALGIVL